MFGSFQIDHASTRGRTGPVFGGFGLSGVGSVVSGGHSGGGTGKFGVGSQSSNSDVMLWRGASSWNVPE